MAGGAGNIGSAGGMGNASAQPQGGPFGGGMGNASAQPQGGPSFAQPYMNNLGGGMGNSSVFETSYPTGGAPRQSTNQSTFGQGMNTMFGGGSPFGMQQQQPMQNPFGQMGALSSPGYGANQFRQQQQMGQQQGPIRQDMSSMGQLGAANQMPQPMGQRPAYMDNPDFQAYQKQEQDLGRQMNEYMQKAPMFQQLQDLQGKLRGFQQPQQGQMQNPYGNIDQMQQQRNMQDQARQQQMWQQATQDDMRAALGHPPLSSSKMDMPSPENVAPEFGNFGERRMGGGFGRRGMGGGYGRQMPQQAMGLQGLYSMLQGRRGGPFGGY
jgi:hypothetical protein